MTLNRRTATGLAILAAVIAAILYIWQPWNRSGVPPLKLGLDLQGGLRVVLQSEEANPLRADLDTARNVIENRINQVGVSEPLIQTSGTDRIIVELPGLTTEDQNRALDLIGQQAILEFRLVRPASGDAPSSQLTADDLEDVAFTGEIVRSAQADFGPPGERADRSRGGRSISNGNSPTISAPSPAAMWDVAWRSFSTG